MIGAIFHNRYEILDVLGTGGTAIVYKGKDLLLNRLVTIKILREQYASDDQFVRRFRQEAQAVACLSHPNIVSIYDVVFEGDSHYLVMEYVEGCSLKEYMDEHGPLPMELSLKIIAQILKALQHAHEHNVVHRDIKPHNILLDQNLDVKVTDFGIAVAVTDITQTYTKDVMGSVHYMSPEQVKGAKVNESSDLYSVGVMLYELLTGVQPFGGDNAIGVAMQHIQGEVVPPHKMNPNISRELSYVVMKAMRKDADLRFASASEMLQALRGATINPKSKQRLQEEDAFHDPSVIVPPVSSRDELQDFELPPEKQRRRQAPFYEDEEDYDDGYDQGYGDYDRYEEDENYPPQKQKLKKQPKAAVQPGKGGKYFINKRPTKQGWVAIALGTAGVIALVSIISIFFSIFGFGGEKDVEVPDVMNKPLTEAEEMLNEVNLQYSVTRVADDEAEVDTVLNQDIPAGQTVKEGRVINLEVSKGPQLILVPDVKNLSTRDASLAITNKNLTVKVEEVTSSSADAGTVISQSPESNEEVKAGTEVTIRVSKPKMTTVPKLTGLTSEQAKAKLAESKLLLGDDSSKKESTEYVAGIVLEQSVSAGSSVAEGSSVNLVLSDGPGPAAKKARVTYTLPDTEESYTVKIVVTDTTGSHEEYNAKHQGGETVVKEVSFYNKGKIQVLLDGEVVYSEDVQ